MIRSYCGGYNLHISSEALCDFLDDGWRDHD